MTPTVFVDYEDGAQGETLAYFLNSHQEFGDHEFVDQSLQDIDGQGIKWFNSHSLVSADWDENFEKYLDSWHTDTSRARVLSYHLYKYPEHIDILKARVPGVRFVKINSAGYENFYKYDYIRKVLLRKLNKHNLNEIKFLTPEQHKIKIVQLLQHNQLLGVDLALAVSGQPITPQNRQIYIRDFLDQRVNPPSQDIEILYHDWFLDTASTAQAYDRLCDQLKICPDDDKLHKLISKNDRNLKELQSFILNFDNLMDQL